MPAAGKLFIGSIKYKKKNAQFYHSDIRNINILILFIYKSCPESYVY